MSNAKRRYRRRRRAARFERRMMAACHVYLMRRFAAKPIFEALRIDRDLSADKYVIRGVVVMPAPVFTTRLVFTVTE